MPALIWSWASCPRLEWDRNAAPFKLNRSEARLCAKAVSYGFIPPTLDEDGDELDAPIITDAPLSTGIFLEARIPGGMQLVDDGEVHDKITVAPADAHHTGNFLKKLNDTPKQWAKRIEQHLSHYKDLKNPGSTKAQEWQSMPEAEKIMDAIAR